MRKTVFASVISLMLLVAFVFVFESAVRYHRRSQAEKLLAAVRNLHPGTATRTQVIYKLEPFAQWKENGEDEISYSLDNNPVLIPQVLLTVPHLPLSPPWTLFSITLRFYKGLLAEIEITEMQQDHPGYPHPNSAKTRILSYDFAETRMDDQVPYSSNTQTTGEVDKEGHWTGFKCCYERFIILDSRATPSQFNESLNFQLSCLTSFIPCNDDRKILP